MIILFLCLGAFFFFFFFLKVLPENDSLGQDNCDNCGRIGTGLEPLKYTSPLSIRTINLDDGSSCYRKGEYCKKCSKNSSYNFLSEEDSVKFEEA